MAVSISQSLLSRNVPFQRLFWAHVVSLVGSGLSSVALGLLANQLVGASASAVLGVTLTIRIVVIVLCAPWAGLVADRLGARTIMILSDLFRALVVIGNTGLLEAVAEDPTERILESTLRGFAEEYSELSENWRSLDSKAQGAITVSGLFLAGLLAFARTLIESSSYLEKSALTAAILLLIISVIFSLNVLRVRTVESPPIGKTLRSLVDELLSDEDDLDVEARCNFLRDHSEMWKTTNAAVQRVNDSKASSLYRGQVFLIVAIVFAALATWFRIWT